jgi:hypothetical protein
MPPKNTPNAIAKIAFLSRFVEDGANESEPHL